MPGFGSANPGGNVINAKDHGAIGDGKLALTAQMSSGTNIVSLINTTSQAQDLFSSADVGKSIVISWAGPFTGDLFTTITGFTDSTHVTVAANASQSTPGPSIAYWYPAGRDDTAGLQAASNAATQSHTTLYIPEGIYIYSGTNPALGALSNSQYLGAIIGDGPTRTWICAANPSQTCHALLLTDVPIGFRLQGFTVRGPGIDAAQGGGIIFNLVVSSNINLVRVEQVNVMQSAEFGFYMDVPILTTFANCLAEWCVEDCFYVQNGTSVHFDACYALTSVLSGFSFNTMAYCSLNACAVESSGIGYFYHNSEAITVQGSGFEALNDRSGSFGGVLYKGHGHVIQGGRGGIQLNACYGSGVATTSSRHVLCLGAAEAVTVEAFCINNPGLGATPTYDFEVDSGCSNIQFINPIGTDFTKLSDAGDNTAYSQGNLQAALATHPNSPSLHMPAAGVTGWSSDTNPMHNPDTGLSRVAAGVVGVGNGTAGDYSSALRGAAAYFAFQRMPSNGVLGWTASADPTASPDTGFSRDSAGVIMAGNGTADDASATLNMAQCFAKRIMGRLGTTVTTGAFALSGGWGSGASVSLLNATSKDTGGSIQISASGTTGVNPTVTFTFQDGSWGHAPSVIPSRGDVNTPITGYWVIDGSATTGSVVTFTFIGTPITGTNYSLSWIAMGT